MKAYLIDPAAKTVNEVDYSGEFTGPKGAYELIGTDIVEIVTLDNGHSVAVDEEGSFKPNHHVFHIRGLRTASVYGVGTLIGKALVTGPVNDAGIETAPTMTLDELKQRVRFG